MADRDDPARAGDPANDERVFFTLDEANGVLPELTRRFATVELRIGRAREITAHLSSLGGAHPGGLRDELKQIYADIQLQLSKIQKLGCVVKDIQKGLVDFWHLRRGQEVFLCWRVGEVSIEWFHDPAEGFAGRKPLLDGDRDPSGSSPTSSLH